MTDQPPYSWPGRKRPRGRPVFSRGPIIFGLEVANVLTSVMALGALVLAIILFSQRIDAIQQSRYRAALDSCNILQVLILDATPRGKLPLANRFLHRAGLDDCQRYARDIRRAQR